MRLPIWDTTMDVFDYCWRERRMLVRYGGIPAAVVIAVGLAATVSGFNRPGGAGTFGFQTQALATMASPERRMFVTFAIVQALVQITVYLAPTVTWYRIVVYGEDAAKQRPLFTIGRTELRLLLWQIYLLAAVGLMAVAGVFVIALINAVLSKMGHAQAGAVAALVLALALIVGTLLIMTRLSLVLVLAALDQPVSFKAAWAMTKGMSWRLLAMLVLIALSGILLGLVLRLVSLLVSMITAMATGSTAHAILPYLTVVTTSAVGLVIFMASATLFGFVYRGLTAAPEAAASEVAA